LLRLSPSKRVGDTAYRALESLLMRATADTIWSVPAYLPYLQPPLTNEAVANAEKAIGYALSPEYVALLKKQNGGYIRFSLPESPHRRISGIGPFFPSLADVDWTDHQEIVSFPLKGLIPFDGEGHWHLCFDYRGNSSVPSVTYIDIESDRQSTIAATFAGYLQLLRIEVGDAYVLEAVAEIDAVIAALSKSLAASFEAPDDWAHGYPVHRVRLGGQHPPEWIWISPNTVPRGFVRTNHSRYSELRDRLPGEAERFPGLPTQSYILEATDGARSAAIDACAKSRVTFRPLREYVNQS
jgi:hypothetical protein